MYVASPAQKPRPRDRVRFGVSDANSRFKHPLQAHKTNAAHSWGAEQPDSRPGVSHELRDSTPSRALLDERMQRGRPWHPCVSPCVRELPGRTSMSGRSTPLECTALVCIPARRLGSSSARQWGSRARPSWPTCASGTGRATCNRHGGRFRVPAWVSGSDAGAGQCCAGASLTQLVAM
jgi:hypothetical protein